MTDFTTDFGWLPRNAVEDCALLQSLFDALGSKDLDAGIACFHEDAEYHSAFAGAEGGLPYQGHRGVRKYYETVFELFDTWQLEPSNFICSEGRVLCLALFAFSGKESHVEMSQAVGTVWIIEDGLIRRGFGFLNVDDAIAGMARQCGREAGEIALLIADAERAKRAFRESAAGSTARR